MKTTFSLLLFIGFLAAAGCKHEPIIPHETIDPIDTIPIDTLPDDTIVSTCDPDTSYFQNDVLPIFASSCAVPGCHDAISHEEGVTLTNYNTIVNTGDVNPGNPNGSDVYQVMIDNNPWDRMPPPGSGITLTQDQLNTVRDWIAQGALNNSCIESAACDTVNVSYLTDVRPIISTYCLGCHNASAPQGGIALSTFDQVNATVTSGRLIGSIEHLAGFSAMPKNQAKLSACRIALIRNWINQGALNN
jgi:mono/diheme cytochrome c family protein